MLSAFTRKGPWVPPRRFNRLAFCGDGTIDLREAHFAHDELTVRVAAILSAVTVIVPEDAEVHASGTGVIGDFDQTTSGTWRQGAPRIVVTGLAFLSEVSIQRASRDV